MSLAFIFDENIVNEKSEDYGSGFVFPEARYVWFCCITLLGDVLLEADVGGKSVLSESAHTLFNLHLHIAIFYQR